MPYFKEILLASPCTLKIMDSKPLLIPLNIFFLNVIIIKQFINSLSFFEVVSYHDDLQCMYFTPPPLFCIML